MIKEAWRRLTGWLASATLAVVLLVFVGAWSLLATFVAQGPAADPGVRTWAAEHGAIEPVVRALGLHQAFTSYAFLVAIVLLGVSTCVCSWKRTKVALSRAKLLSSAKRADAQTLRDSHDLEVACDPGLDESRILSLAEETLRRLGVSARREGDVLQGVSAPWVVWGSAVFHWSLVALILVVLGGQLVRSEGSINVAVGQTVADARDSYSQIVAGPLHTWNGVNRSVRLDSFEPDYKLGGIDRGAVPTVSLLDGNGSVVATQRVYQNMMLHNGSLSINAPGLGLAVTLGLVDSTGNEVRRSIQYASFSQNTTDGTVPINEIVRRDDAGNVVQRVMVTVPLEGTRGHFGEYVPRPPRARVSVVSGDGATLFDQVLSPGQGAQLPGGAGVKLDGVDWYSRLSLVDDPTIPLIYASMVVATLGLAMTVALRQQSVVATVMTDGDGSRLAMDLRLWRNVPTSASEVRGELERALGSVEKEGVA